MKPPEGQQIDLTEHFMPVVNGRPVGIICPGYSLKVLDDNIDRFSNIPICWGTMNFHPHADEILAKIGKKVEFMLAFCNPWQNKHFDGLKLTLAHARGGSVQEFLMQCIDNELDIRIFIFGLDGTPPDREKFYYGGLARNNPFDLYEKDTNTFNNEFPKDLFKPSIFNCSSGSKITSLKNITIEECIDRVRRK